MSNGTSLTNYTGFLEYLAAVIKVTGGVPVVEAKCPECGGTWAVWRKVCASSEEYACGYRSIWKCQNDDCGEMEIR